MPTPTRHGGDDQREDEHGLRDGLDVARFQAVEEPAVPLVERTVGGGRQDQAGGEPQRQHQALKRVAPCQ
jgi:hypothetical protein